MIQCHLWALVMSKRAVLMAINRGTKDQLAVVCLIPADAQEFIYELDLCTSAKLTIQFTITGF